MIRALSMTVAVAGLALAASSASATAIFSYAFNNLDGTFVRNTGPNSNTILGQFTATAVAGNLRSSGSLSRNVSPLTQADFRAGYVTLDAPAGFQLTVSVINPSGTGAQGAGTLTLRDTNNDTITANFTGTWLIAGAGVFFNSSSISYVISNPSGDNAINGSNGSFATTTGYINQQLSGALNQLFLDMNGASSVAQVFSSSFNGVSSTATGQIIPAPASLALAGVGMIFAGRRRR
ncbi:MAG: PEP-CTERM sorting domain-containing protein [Phycisphaerales bacterium]|nr:PEP-CTERM sorting domain-containing protein [Phycisphaerales bacterium]